jgi:hypothetical protein
MAGPHMLTGVLAGLDAIVVLGVLVVVRSSQPVRVP